MRSLLYTIIYGSIIGLGLPLNIVSLWILLRHHGFKSPSAVFMVHLVISDLLLIISLSMRVSVYATDVWNLDKMWCLCFTMLFRNNVRSSSIFITFISVDRLLAVVYPLRSRLIRTPANALKGSALVWLIVLLVNIPESVGFKRNHDNQTCFDADNVTAEAGDKTLEHTIDYIQLVLLLTMLVVNIVSTVMVSCTLQRHLSESARVSNKMNVMLIFAMNLMMFIVFFLPVSLVVFNEAWRPVLSCLASVNCCLDPLLYYFSFDGFWKRKESVETTLANRRTEQTENTAAI